MDENRLPLHMAQLSALRIGGMGSSEVMLSEGERAKNAARHKLKSGTLQPRLMCYKECRPQRCVRPR
jgi:hypothetical protein